MSIQEITLACACGTEKQFKLSGWSIGGAEMPNLIVSLHLSCAVETIRFGNNMFSPKSGSSKRN